MHACHGGDVELHKRKFRWKYNSPSEDNTPPSLYKAELWRRYEIFQACLLDEVGVSGITITNVKSKTPDISITSSSVGFIRIKSHCLAERTCVPLLLASQYRLPQPINPLIYRKEEKVVCLY